jgi:DNA repair protein RadD
MSLILREYQTRTIEKLWAWFRANSTGNPVVEACVSSGKSLMIADTIRQALAYPGTRVVMCVASRELCRQNAEKLVTLWPEAPVGVYSAGLKSKQLGTPILYATIGSIWKRWHELGEVSLLMVDECHQISEKDKGMYRSLIKDLLQVCPFMRVIGWTGTAFFGSGVWITDAEDPLFTDIAARVSMREILDLGFLSPLTVPRTETRLSADGVAMRGGDFIVSQLAKAIDQQALVDSCADELVKLGAERKRWFCYGSTVEHCDHIAAALNARGTPSRVVSANTPHGERDQSLTMLRAGQLRCIVNVATMTTGIDLPELDLICLMRNTRSPVLFVQICGRAMRIHPSKTDALLIDFTDSLEVLGPVDLIKGRARGENKTGEAPYKICDQCGTRNPASARECLECGHPFDILEKPKHSDQVSHAPALSTDLAPRLVRYDIARVSYGPHPGRDGKPPTMKVDYYGPMLRVASEWICFEHAGYARTKAVTWWIERAPGSLVPKTIDEALDRLDELKEPAAMTLDERNKYPEIKTYEWSNANPAIHHPGAQAGHSLSAQQSHGIHGIYPG